MAEQSQPVDASNAQENSSNDSSETQSQPASVPPQLSQSTARSSSFHDSDGGLVTSQVSAANGAIWAMVLGRCRLHITRLCRKLRKVPSIDIVLRSDVSNVDKVQKLTSMKLTALHNQNLIDVESVRLSDLVENWTGFLRGLQTAEGIDEDYLIQEVTKYEAAKLDTDQASGIDSLEQSLQQADQA